MAKHKYNELSQYTQQKIAENRQKSIMAIKCYFMTPLKYKIPNLNKHKTIRRIIHQPSSKYSPSSFGFFQKHKPKCHYKLYLSFD